MVPKIIHLYEKVRMELSMLAVHKDACTLTPHVYSYTTVQRQKAVTGYFASKQLLHLRCYNTQHDIYPFEPSYSNFFTTKSKMLRFLMG